MEELTMYNANCIKVQLEDGTITYIEAQEYCDIWWRTPEDGVAGYYTLFRENNDIYFHNAKRTIVFYGEVVAYSHDWGKTWVEVK